MISKRYSVLAIPVIVLVAFLLLALVRFLFQNKENREAIAKENLRREQVINA